MNPAATDFRFITTPSPGTIHGIIRLYRDAGWWGDQPDNAETVARLIRGSHCFLCVFSGATPIGMGRAIGDGVSDAYIQDVTVDKDFRHHGIGRRIVDNLVNRLEKDGFGWIGLIAERGSQSFYLPLGFAIMENAVPMLKRTK